MYFHADSNKKEKEGAFVKRSNQLMLEGPLFGSIVAYTVPIILTSILQLLFNAADLVVVGQFCGSVSLAAVGATGSLTSLMVNFFIGLSLGAGVCVAHGLGSREDQEVSRTVHTALPVALVSGLGLTAFGIGLSRTFLGWMGTPENVLPLSAVYMKIYFSGITFTIVYNFAAAILRAAGDTKSPLIFLLIAGVVNVGLNVLFVTAFQMNVAGVALATVISQGISAVLVIWALMRREDACKLYWKRLRVYRQQLRKLIRIGLPAGVQSSLFAISNVLIQSSVNSFGDVFMSGSAASGNIEGFVYTSMNAFSQTAVNFIGQNAGAGKYDRIRKIYGICMGCVTVVGLALGSTVCFFGRQLLAIYISDSAEAVDYGMIRLCCICLPYFLCGLMDVSTGALRGMGSSLEPMVISVLGVCGLRILWIYTVFRLPGLHTPVCLFLSYALSWGVTLLAELVVLRRVYRRGSALHTA